MMTTTELRESFINSMTEDIIDERPKMIIRRLQNDNAFAIYIKIKSKDESDVLRNNIVLIDIITEKSEPDFFKTIKKIIKVINNDKGLTITQSNYFLALFYNVELKDKMGNVIEKLIEFDNRIFSTLGGIPGPNDYIDSDDEIKLSESNYFLSLFYNVEVKDKIGNVIEKFIEFDHRTFSTLGGIPGSNDGIDPNDEFNILQMLHVCAKTIRSNNFNEPDPWLCPPYRFQYTFFKYGLVLLDSKAADDEVLNKVITDDLHGYQITYDQNNRYGKIQNESESVYYKLDCHDKSCKMLNGNIDWLHNIVLYYTAKRSKNSKHTVYLKGEFTTWSLFYNSDTCTTKQYIIPRTWFDFEEEYYYDIKIKNVVCDNCGRNLNPHD